ncbi:glycosyltransferase family 4 protein [Candidatus Falkowbacteria bacterium]|nr:glycosyltransferase family 4 protein [Candidatus Falkowbacteria bacterium]
MKIAQVTCVFPPYKGGMGNVAFHYSWELAKLGHQITVFTPHYRTRTEQFKDFTIKSLVPWLKYGHGYFLPQLLWELRQFDIVHLHYPFLGSELPVGLLKQLRPNKTKLVVTYHMDLIGSGWLAKYFAWHVRHFTPWIMKLADKVIVTSRDYVATSQIAPLLGTYVDKIVEIPLGADTWILQPAPKDKELLHHHRLTPGTKVILFVAALDRAHYFKGLDNLLQAMTRLQDVPPVRLMVIGRGHLRETYEQRAAELNLGDAVEFVGYVGDWDLVKYYNLCDLFVLPSTDRSEAFGLVYTEAMACAKPVIGSNLAGVRSVIEDGVNGLLVEPNNIEDLAQKMRTILTNDDLAARFGAAGLKKVQEKYNWRSIAGQLDQLYQQVRSSL